METIQVKTVDPISQDLLKSAYQKGIKLAWDRFEKLQPQDGFLRMGLSCPYGCLQGPCRIDPFGRGPERGLCGLDRDGMVAALLLRLSLSGALEAMPAPAKEFSWDPALKDAVSRVSKKLVGEPISSAEIQTAASRLIRPMESPEGLINQSLRLALLTIGWLAKGGAS
jgi:hydroxylamine reductase (hybrid-cluster protein)